tara:strand:+ start:643 stop:2622 length:1980 start_codon:yes stop_codon:yes gene_type:complete
MATTPIKLKRSHTQAVIPDTSDLIAGEVALNTVDKKFYVRDDSNAIVTLSNHYGTDFDTNVVTFKVTVASSTSAHTYHGTGSSNKYKINGVFSPYLKLIPRITYRFDQSDSSNSGHPLRFYYDAAKATQYSTGVTVVSGSGGPGTSGAYTQIVVSDSTPQVLFYQCSAHGYMGWALTTSTRNLTGFDTDDLSAGSSNLYYTDSRVQTYISGNRSYGNISTTGSITAGGTVISDASNYATIEMNGTNGAHIDLKVGGADYTGRVIATSSSMDLIHDVVKLQSKTSAHNYLVGTQGGSVELYHNNSKKLETASGGVTITGTLNGHTIPGGSGTIALTSDVTSGSITIQDEGSSLSTQATTLNFVGSGVTATGSGTTKTITISGGGGSGSSAADDITTGDAAVTIATTSGNITIDNQHSNSDIIFKGTDGGSDITALTLDMSNAGDALFNASVRVGASGAYKFADTHSSDSAQIFVDTTETSGQQTNMIIQVGDDATTSNQDQVRIRHRNYGNANPQDLDIAIFKRDATDNTKGNTAFNGDVSVSGLLSATTKSFDIEHPTLDNMRLRYGVLEGPEHGVYVRGKLENNSVIELPEHWLGLVDGDTITVQLTPNSKHQKLYVKEIKDNKIKIGNSSLLSKINCFYFVQATRKDVDRLEVEYEN